MVAAFGIHPQYQATATILLEPSSVPKDIIESTVMSYSDQQIEIVQGRVMTLDSMLAIVRDIDPYPSEDVERQGESAAASRRYVGRTRRSGDHEDGGRVELVFVALRQPKSGARYCHR